MTLLTLRASILNRLGAPSTDAFYTDTRLTALVNDSLQYITSLGDWSWLEASETISTVSGTDTYSVAAAAMRTIDLVDPTGVPLVRKPIDELEYMPGGSAQSGTVRFFANFAAQVVIRPVPNAIIALKHRYVRSEPLLASDSDTPLMPDQYQGAIVDRAVYLAELAAGNTTMAKAAQTSFDEWVATMRETADRRAKTTGGGQDNSAAPAPGA